MMLEFLGHQEAAGAIVAAIERDAGGSGGAAHARHRRQGDDDRGRQSDRRRDLIVGPATRRGARLCGTIVRGD